MDATAESGRLGRLLNHSRNGNCTTKVLDIDGRPYLLLIADQDIAEGQCSGLDVPTPVLSCLDGGQVAVCDLAHAEMQKHKLAV